jgi:hypothetical protein
LTEGPPNAALHILQILAFMSDLVDDIVRSYGRDIGEMTIGKVRNYISLLASTGKSKEQLLALGRAGLDEILEPDPRYSGC